MTRRAEPLGRVRVELLDAQAADRPGDHELLDLLGALEDVVGLLKASDPAVGESVATAAIGIAYLGPHDLRRRLAGTRYPAGPRRSTSAWCSRRQRRALAHADERERGWPRWRSSRATGDHRAATHAPWAMTKVLTGRCRPSSGRRVRGCTRRTPRSVRRPGGGGRALDVPVRCDRRRRGSGG